MMWQDLHFFLKPLARSGVARQIGRIDRRPCSVLFLAGVSVRAIIDPTSARGSGSGNSASPIRW